MSESIPFVKDDQIKNPAFADITEMPRPEALKLLRNSKQAGILPVNLKEICEFETVPLRFVHLPDANTAARFVQTKGDWFIEVDNEGTGETDFSQDDVKRARQRFSVAHELGHYKYKSHCDRALQGQLLSGHNPHAGRYLREKETQANEFASELLLPLPDLKPHLKNLDFKDDLFGSMSKIAETFDTSMLATTKRVASVLDIEVVAIHFLPDGKSHQVPSFSAAYKDAYFYFDRNGSIPASSYASHMFEGKTAAPKGRKVHPDCRVWFPARKRDDYKTVEWVFSLGQYGLLVFLELISKDSW